jgi:hypothetical protein
MTRKRTPAAFLAFVILAGSTLFSLACLDEGPVLQPSEAESSDEALAEECDNVLGKAFISPEQRQWFIENCSTWPQRDVPEAAGVEEMQDDTPECAEMRGKPYESPEQRTWFLTNCVRGSSAVQQPAVSGPDRTTCEEIRGTAYRSPAERQWYLANCLTPVAQPVTNGGDQNDDDDDDEPRNGNGRNGNGRNR